MHYSNRFLQFTLKSLLIIGSVHYLPNSLAQNTPAASSAASESSSARSSEKPIYSSVPERDNTLLVNAFTAIAKADEIQWLESPNEKFIALYKEGETRRTKGILLMLHTPETPQLWPASLENLRRNLPVYGWGTMAVPLLAQYPTEQPKREPPTPVNSTSEESSSAASSSSEAPSESSKPAIPRSQLIASRVDAAIAHLNKNSQFNIVVLVDNSSAPDALDALYKKINKNTTTSETIDGPVQALVLMNMQNQEPLTKAQLTAIFSVGDMPIIDVFFNVDNKAQAELRRIHKAEAMRQNVKDYQQFILLPEHMATVDDKQSFWIGKIHGFIEKKAQGSEFKNNEQPTKIDSTIKTDANMQ